MIRKNLILKIFLLISLSSLTIAGKSNPINKYENSYCKYKNRLFRTSLLAYLSLSSLLNPAFSLEELQKNSARLIVRPKKKYTKGHLRGLGNYEVNIAEKIMENAHHYSSSVEAKHVKDMANFFQLIEINGDEISDDIEEIATQLSLDQEIDKVIIDFPVKAYSDPLAKKQWFLDQGKGVGAKNLWKHGITGEGITIAVLDTGLAEHEDLRDQVVGGYDFISNQYNADDGDGRDQDYTDTYKENDQAWTGRLSDVPWHGTHVAGTIAANHNNGKGGSGVAPKAKLLILRVLGKNGGTFADVLNAISWAVGFSIPGIPDNENPADIINLSLGGAGICTEDIDQFFGEIKQHAIVVAAAGNEGKNLDLQPSSPASCSNVFTVTATGPEKSLASYANIGSSIDVAAPGGDLLKSKTDGILAPIGGQSDNHYDFYEGTSMATAVVSASFALIKNYLNQSDLSTDDYIDIMTNTTKPIEGCEDCDFGLIDLTLLSKNFTSAGSKNFIGKTNLALVAGLTVCLGIFFP